MKTKVKEKKMMEKLLSLLKVSTTLLLTRTCLLSFLLSIYLLITKYIATTIDGATPNFKLSNNISIIQIKATIIINNNNCHIIIIALSLNYILNNLLLKSINKSSYSCLPVRECKLKNLIYTFFSSSN